tara:strand:+ start:652 stop:1245 length:594 start_codon:yes stop_codon:yes gene_type:complete
MIPIKETFLSIQGEGYYVGQSSYFIRTQGCDIGCHWCDEPKSWQLNAGVKMTASALLRDIKKVNTNIVIFTGGEPLMHDLNSVSCAIKNAGYKLHLETSGGYPLSGDWDWITLSPKKVKPPLPEIYPLASELKIIIYNQDDFKWALKQEENVSKSCLLYLQPEWSNFQFMKPKIIDFISKNTRWKLSLQMHKYLDIK